MSFTHFKLKPNQGEILDQIINLDKDLIQYSWSSSSWSEFNFELDHIWFYQSEGAPIAFILCRHVPKDDQFHLLKIAVDKKYRSQGIAKELMGLAEPYFKELGALKSVLEVADSNNRAVDVYKASGYETVHHSKNFYSDGGHAFIMVKML